MKTSTINKLPDRASLGVKRRPILTFITAFAVSACCLFPGDTLEGKGNGKGKGGGGDGGDRDGGTELPSLVAAPVLYEIARLEWPEPYLNFTIEAIKSDGLGVGYVKPASSGQNRAMAADSSGMTWDLNNVFASALAANFPGMRFNHVGEINESGVFAGVLVPDDQDSSYDSNRHVLVAGVLDFDNFGLEELDRFEDGTASGEFRNISDLNENGNLLVGTRSIDGTNRLKLYERIQDGVSLPVVLPLPGRAIQDGLWATINGSGEMARSIQVSKRKWHTMISSLDSNQVDLDLGAIGRMPWISGSGAVYELPIPLGDSTPQRWSPVSGEWETFSPPGQIHGVTSAEEVLLRPVAASPDPATPMVYKHGVGTFLVEVTGTPEDEAFWDAHSAPNEREPQGSARAISEPTATGHGRIVVTTWKDNAQTGLLILTPVLVP